MEKKHHDFMHSSEAADLRGRAEAQIEPNSVQRLPSATEALRMVHELRVQQVELELQNQELEAIRRRPEQSLERYTDLYDFAPVCYATLADDSTIREINLIGAKLLGMERAHLIGQRLGFFVSVDTRPIFVTRWFGCFFGGLRSANPPYVKERHEKTDPCKVGGRG